MTTTLSRNQGETRTNSVPLTHCTPLKLHRSVFLQNCAVNLDTCTLITLPRSQASQKPSSHVERSQKVIETSLILHGTSHAFGQPLPDRISISGSPDCVGIVLKQNNFATIALPLHDIFTSF